MKVKSAAAVALIASWLLFGCGPHRIEKLAIPPEDMILSYRLMAEGDELLSEGKDHFALLKYLDASTLNPYHEVIFNKLAIAYSRLHRFYQAERAVRRAVGLNPDYPYAYNTYGIIQLAGKDPEGAIDSFQKAIGLNPEAANFYINLGYAQVQTLEFEDGLNSYRRALAMDPEILNKEEAIQLSYARGEEPDPEQPYQMARLFAELGNKESCLHYLHKALSLGFSDRERLQKENAFEKWRGDSDFITLLGSYGISLSSSSFGSSAPTPSGS
ncbi:MAG: TPR end-of-group domain-containing protein [Acidobacteriota bacterium]